MSCRGFRLLAQAASRSRGVQRGQFIGSRKYFYSVTVHDLGPGPEAGGAILEEGLLSERQENK